MARSAEQRAKNESTFRGANEKLEDKVVEFSLTEERTPYLCECDDPSCTAIIRLTIPEYEAVRSNPRQFAVVPDHDASPDRIVDEHEGSPSSRRPATRVHSSKGTIRGPEITLQHHKRR